MKNESIHHREVKTRLLIKLPRIHSRIFPSGKHTDRYKLDSNSVPQLCVFVGVGRWMMQ